MGNIEEKIAELVEKKFVCNNWALFTQIYHREWRGNKPGNYEYYGVDNLEKDAIMIVSSIERLETEEGEFLRFLLHPSQQDDDGLTYFDLDFMYEFIEPIKNINFLRLLNNQDLIALLSIFKGFIKNYSRVRLYK